MTNKSNALSEKSLLRPFRVDVPEADLVDLKQRLERARLPEKETVHDFSQGVPLKTIRQVLEYWRTKYDWRKVETRLNAVPNFITEIDGLDKVAKGGHFAAWEQPKLFTEELRNGFRALRKQLA